MVSGPPPQNSLSVRLFTLLICLRICLRICLLICFGALHSVSAIGTEDLEFFERRIRPVLAENCFECHGPGEQESELRLDHISSVLAGGTRGAAIVARHPAESLLVEAIDYRNVDLQMPPSGRLPESVRADLREWIRRGAPWPDEPRPEANIEPDPFDLAERKQAHWAWQPIARFEPPAVQNKAWSLGPIDRFILAKLEAAGLAPAEAADKRTLMRR